MHQTGTNMIARKVLWYEASAIFFIMAIILALTVGYFMMKRARLEKEKALTAENDNNAT